MSRENINFDGFVTASFVSQHDHIGDYKSMCWGVNHSSTLKI